MLLAVLVLILVTAVPLFDHSPNLDRTLTRLAAEIEARGYRWQAGYTGISDLSPEEFQALLGARISPAEEALFGPLAAQPLGPQALGEGSSADLPTCWDWRERGAATPVRQQGNCGACWAFAAGGALEGQLALYDDRQTRISVQHAISCNSSDYGCDGGWMTAAYRLWKDQGALREEDFPYTGRDDDPCLTGGITPISSVISWTALEGTRESIQRALLVGPLAVGMHVYADFQHYRDGVYEHAGSDPINHAVLLVGWDDQLDAWIMKNSWGTNWGLGGYALVAYDCCRLGSYPHLLRIPAAHPVRIHHTPLPDQITAEGPAEIVAIAVSMDRALDPASVVLMADLGEGYVARAMTRLGGDMQAGTYRSVLGLPAAGTRVRYYIQAQDVTGRLSTHPAAGSVAPNEFRVLHRAYWMDLESAQGWLVGETGDDATAGIWEWGTPQATFSYPGTYVQPEGDHTPEGSRCYVTGLLAGSDAEANDLDGGRTTLTSPPLDLSTFETATLRFWLWFSNQWGSAPREDPFEVELSNDGGETWITVFETLSGRSIWEQIAIPLDAFLSFTERMRLRFVAVDLARASLVEAAIDDVEILTLEAPPGSGPDPGGGNPDPARMPELSLTLGPNPSTGPTNLFLQLPEPSRVTAEIFDAQGRLQQMLWRGDLPAGQNRLLWDGTDSGGRPAPAGRYWARVCVGDATLGRPLVILR